ncbi:Response regulator protein TmoT [Stieleria maiorica]|uniref:Response regulator protein TmoT n=1 Tax=Stieleria maiorica TaxID=2795974 RepID=A0A5B9MPS4_9BACT|nr:MULTISPECIES: response regulator [Pirellulaceae]QEG01686.1 Response regulator protein TmoT [Stieleria maiorica]
MSWQQQVIFVVDDDERARESVCALVSSMGLESMAFASAEDFLAYYTKDKPGCLVTDIRMLGMSGLELQAELSDMGSLLPVIVLTAFATTPVTVQAIQRGAITLLDKPYVDDDLWNAIRKALAQDARKRVEEAHRQAIRERINELTPSERTVLSYVVAGKPNKVIANRLDVSVRTVENRRSEIYTKLQAESVVDLVRMVIEADMLDT